MYNTRKIKYVKCRGQKIIYRHNYLYAKNTTTLGTLYKYLKHLIQIIIGTELHEYIKRKYNHSPGSNVMLVSILRVLTYHKCNTKY